MQRMYFALFAAFLMIANSAYLPASAQAAEYGFKEAVELGVVDFMVNPWAKTDYAGILSSLPKINPGLVNRVGFEYAGVTMKKLDFAAHVASEIHTALPRARIGGGFPENLTKGYSEKLPCDSETDMREFSRPAITGKSAGKSDKYYWIDTALAPAQEYYICIGKAQIRRGFSHFHFEEADNILKQSSSKRAAVEGFARVRDALIEYAKSQKMSLSFSGEPELAKDIPLESVYIPARFYTTAFFTEFQNKISTKVGKGYTYALSTQIVSHYSELVPSRTRVMFYVDNFDYKQDDLRRMMELDGPNRRELIIRSATVAHEHNVTFIPSLDHCDGCIPADLVGDPCEFLPGGKVSYYDESACGDLEAIKHALEVEGQPK